jgi:hypothetical protein
MLKFADFVPKPLAEAVQTSGFFKLTVNPEFEHFTDAVQAASEWVEAQDGIRVLHVETVVLPNIWLPGETGSSDTALRTTSQATSFWHQFVRVWYQED